MPYAVEAFIREEGFMDLTNMKSEIAKRMPVKRFEHVFRVMETARILPRSIMYCG